MSPRPKSAYQGFLSVSHSVTSQTQKTLACLFWHVVTSLTSTMFWRSDTLSRHRHQLRWSRCGGPAPLQCMQNETNKHQPPGQRQVPNFPKLSKLNLNRLTIIQNNQFSTNVIYFIITKWYSTDRRQHDTMILSRIMLLAAFTIKSSWSCRNPRLDAWKLWFDLATILPKGFWVGLLLPSHDEMRC